MKRTKLLGFAITLTFCAGLFWSAQAQSPTRATKLLAIETSPGVEDKERGVINGISFLGKTTGTYPGSFFMSMNYTTTSRFASFPPISSVNTIKDGTWSLPVYRSGQYQGAIYGRVVDGTMEWNEDNTIAKVNIIFSVNAGTQTFVNASGKGNFVGTLDRSTRGKPTLNGALFYEF